MKTTTKRLFYHEATIHRRKNDIKKTKRKSRACEVNKFSEIEKGGCMKTFIDMWLVELARILRHPLRGDDNLFPTLTKDGKLNPRKK